MNESGTEKEKYENSSIEAEASALSDLIEKMPNARYRLVEDINEAEPGYCNGGIYPYQVDILRDELDDIPRISDAPKFLEISAHIAIVNKVSSDEQESYRALVVKAGDYTLRRSINKSGKQTIEYDPFAKELLSKGINILKERILRTTYMEFRIV